MLERCAFWKKWLECSSSCRAGTGRSARALFQRKWGSIAGFGRERNTCRTCVRKMLWWWRGEWVKEGWLPGSLRVVARLQGRDSEDLGSWGGGTEEGGSRAGTCPKLEGSPLKFRSDWVYWEKEDAFEKHKSLLTLLGTIGLGCFQGVEPHWEAERGRKGT